VSRPRISSRLTLPAVLAVLASFAACGGDDSDKPSETTGRTTTGATSTTASDGDSLITGEDISAAGEDSPAGTLLKWWQSLQFGDAQGARRLYAEDVSPRGLSDAIRRLKSAFVNSTIEVRETEAGSSVARLLVIISTSSGRGPSRRIDESPTTFRLVREDDAWKLADNRYLNARIRALDEAADANGG
jgi:hypothetical protein